MHNLVHGRCYGKDKPGAVHAGIQARSGQIDWCRIEYRGHRRDSRLPDQTLYNWLKAHREGRLGGPGTKPVTPEQMELARLRAELAKTKMELDIVKKAAAYFAKQST